MTEKMPKPDDVVFGYRIVRVIGKGGMGAVFEGIDDKTGQRAAIKVLHAQLTHDPENLARFLNEAKAISALNHPGIVRLLGSGELDGGGWFIAMDYVDGETLSARLKREKRLGRAGLRLASQIASALQSAHRRNIIHRDLKPSNILLKPSDSGEPEIRIIDFGIAKMAAEDREVQDFHTRTGTMIGTPVYMAPEQCRGVTVTDRTDVYALGIILYQMLTGRPPFYSQADGDILAMHILVPPRPLRDVEPAVPEKVAAFVERMLAKEATERPSMAEVELLLRELAEDPSWSSPAIEQDDTSSVSLPISLETPESLPTQVSRGLAAPTLGAIHGQTAAPTRKSGIRTSLAITAAAVVVVGSLLAALQVRQRHTPQPTVAPEPPRVVVTQLPKSVRWMLRTNPAGASVLDEAGQELGQTPWQVEHPSGSGEQVVIIRKSGFIDIKISFAKDRDVERSEALVAVRPPPPEPRPPTPTPKRPAVSKGRKNDSLILDFKTHKKLN
jgi:serine/threonine protein kinase